MAVSEQEQRREATSTKVTNGSHDGGVQRGQVGAETITEISDKDYRSFCLPCDLLEETDEREQGR
jgi:hypothetical protein